MAAYLVTGGAGFIGSHVVQALARSGHTVRILDDLSNGRAENLSECTTDVELLEGNVRDADRVAAAARGTVGIFHLAALGSVPRSFEDPDGTFATNVDGTRAVMAAARAGGVRRVVCASSSSVYGAGHSEVHRESDPVAPLSPYAESKLAAERICLSEGAAGAPEAVCLRYFNVFGPRQDPSSPYAAVIPRFISRLMAARAPKIYGNGEQTRDFTYVADIVAGTMAAMGAPEARGRVLNLGAGRRTSVNRLAAVLCELLGADVESEHVAPRPGEARHSTADITLARRVLGYAPDWTLTQGLRATVAWHRDRSEVNVP